MDMESFRSHLETYFVDHYQGLPQPLNSNEISAIEKLAEEKYSKESWILGYSPKFKFNLSFEGEGISISTEKGKVVGLEGNHPGTNQIQDVLMGLFYSYENINSALKELSWESNRKINLLSSIFGN